MTEERDKRIKVLAEFAKVVAQQRELTKFLFVEPLLGRAGLVRVLRYVLPNPGEAVSKIGNTARPRRVRRIAERPDLEGQIALGIVASGASGDDVSQYGVPTSRNRDQVVPPLNGCAPAEDAGWWISAEERDDFPDLGLAELANGNALKECPLNDRERETGGSALRDFREFQSASALLR